MSNLIFSSTKSLEDEADCGHQVSDCFVIPDDAKKYVENNPQKFTLRERQLFRMICNQDVISKQGTEMLLKKVNVKSLINRGIIKQSSPCTEFCIKLRGFSGDKSIHEPKVSQTRTTQTGVTQNRKIQKDNEDIDPALRLLAQS